MIAIHLYSLTVQATFVCASSYAYKNPLSTFKHGPKQGGAGKKTDEQNEKKKVNVADKTHRNSKIRAPPPSGLAQLL